MKKRIFAMLLTIVMLFTISGCGNSAAESYKTMAQGFVNEGDISAAIKILEEGIEKTQSEELQAMLEELSKVDYASYAGVWAEEGICWDFGGLLLDVTVTDATLSLICSLIQAAPASRIAEISHEIALKDIKEPTISFPFEDDGWGNSGTLTINFGNNTVECTFSDITFNDMAVWGFYEETYSLVKNDSAYQELEYTQEEYDALYGDPEPVYDTSKASGMLAQAGLTEDQFKSISTPIMSKYESRNEFAYARGRQYYAEHPDENTRIDSYTKDWNDYKTNAKQLHSFSDTVQWAFGKSQTLDDFLNLCIYGPTGASVIGKESEAVFERMFEYPQEYVGKPFLLKEFLVESIDNYKYTLRDSITYDATIIVTDRRDNVMNPTVLNGYYDMYVVFDGNGTTYSGTPVLYFSVLFLNKCE